VSLAVLNYVERHDLLANARARGLELRDGLVSLSQRYPEVVDVRGRGLLWGFELVHDRQTRRAPDPSRNATGTLVDACMAEGLVVYSAGIAPTNNAAILAPPLSITSSEIDALLTRLDRGLARMTNEMAQW
jgi:4-aminobutyrate aminotransferase-like enzyme